MKMAVVSNHESGVVEFSGWRFLSDFAIPGAVEASRGDVADIDVTVNSGPIDARLKEPVTKHAVWRTGTDGPVLLSLPGIGRFLMSGGRHVAVEPALGADLLTIGFLLGGPVLAVLARQRGLLPMDGAALGWRGGSLMLVGPSGQGKSSLAVALATKGWPVLADGVLAIDPTSPGLLRGAPYLRLWRRPALALGVDLDHGAPLRSGVQRFDTVEERAMAKSAMAPAITWR